MMNTSDSRRFFHLLSCFNLPCWSNQVDPDSTHTFQCFFSESALPLQTWRAQCAFSCPILHSYLSHFYLMPLILSGEGFVGCVSCWHGMDLDFYFVLDLFLIWITLRLLIFFCMHLHQMKGNAVQARVQHNFLFVKSRSLLGAARESVTQSSR